MRAPAMEQMAGEAPDLRRADDNGGQAEDLQEQH